MLSTKGIIPQVAVRGGGARSLSVLASSSQLTGARSQQHQLQQTRTFIGLIDAVDKRVYRWAKGIMPPISKTEQIALGCGTVGTFLLKRSRHAFAWPLHKLAK
jgi:hypothetical protein